MLKKIAAGLAVVALIFAIAINQRHQIMVYLVGTGGPLDLLTDVADIPGAEWFDDYYVVLKLDERTFAIGEPLYPQKNYNYLILGSTRAILFDAGAGHHDIRPVIENLTDLPVTFVPSHFHYDHTGNEISFDRVAVVDLPHIRKQSDGNRLQLSWEQHLGSAEGIDIPLLEVDEWLAPGSYIDLGDRKLKVLYTPGHTDDSISLLDEASSTLFSGDFLYPGELYAFVPGSGMADYAQAAKTIISEAPSGLNIYGAHNGKGDGLPELEIADVIALKSQMARIRSGELRGDGFYPVAYRINDRLQLLAEPKWLQNWKPSYPDLQSKQIAN